jgi:pyrimidine operon attenuation protein/uracil phosphoribosyltransferase
MNKNMLDSDKIDQIIKKMALEIIEQCQNLSKVAFVGIRTRGAFLADRLKKEVRAVSGVDVLLGILDITLYRDDLSEKGVQAIVQTTEIDFDVTGAELFLIDDVLFSGRTVRAAMDALIDFGRPKYIKLCVLVERGYRELPLQPDFVGFSIETEYTDKVLVRLSEVDGEDKVVLGKASDFLEQ